MYTWGSSYVLQSHMYAFDFPKFLQRGHLLSFEVQTRAPTWSKLIYCSVHLSFIHILALSKSESPGSNSMNGGELIASNR